MFGFLKRFFSTATGAETAATAPQQPSRAAVPAPVAGAQIVPVPRSLARSADAAPSAQSADATLLGAVVGTPVADPDGVICLPLGPILGSLPAELAGLVAAPSGGTFFLPVRTAMAQLSSGAVRIPFGELRLGSPAGTFYDNATQDRSAVALPLAQILARLDLSLLARRAGQKWVAVPESVTSVFGEGRKLQAPVSAPLRGAEPQAAEARVSAPPAAAVAPPRDALDWLHAPVTGAPQVVRPQAPLTFPKPAPPTAGASDCGLRIADCGLAFPKPSSSEVGASPFTRLPVTERLPSPGPAKAAEAGPVVEREFVEARLSVLSESWPEGVLQVIAECKLQETTISLPLAKLEEGLKKGRVIFTWGDLRQWIEPQPPEREWAGGDVALELPLKVVAPLFLARRRPRAVARQLSGAAEIGENIPDLFGRAAGAAGTAVPANGTALNKGAAPERGLEGIFGVPGRNEWTPAEICRRICALEGVTGSALGMSDGLAVAAQLPAGLSGETVAAFLPKIFGSASQSAGEMRLGPVRGVVLAAGEGRCAIYKAGKLYLAVFGEAGAALPEAMLARIAAEIGKRNA